MYPKFTHPRMLENGLVDELRVVILTYKSSTQ